jgi:hypothetical protein
VNRPNFFILGAPKCGTTSLAEWLSSHPEIFMSRLKEPHFFNTDMQNSKVGDSDGYLKLFARAEAKALGEASTWYLFSKMAVANIERFCHDPKYIIMSRPPSTMVQSLFLHNKRTGAETASTIQEAWDLQESRSEGKNIPKLCREPSYLQYKAACSFGEMAERLFSLVPPERILHIRLQDLSEDARKSYLRVLEFLGVDDDGKSEFSKQNTARKPRHRGIHSILRRLSPLKRMLGIRGSSGFFKLLETPTEKGVESPAMLDDLAKEFTLDRSRMDALGLEY